MRDLTIAKARCNTTFAPDLVHPRERIDAQELWPTSAETQKEKQRSGKSYGVVTVKGRDYYLGAEHGTIACTRAYERFIAEYVANGFAVPDQVEDDPRTTIVELCRDFFRHAKKHYVKDGEQTGTVESFKHTIRALKATFLDLPADDFGPKRLKQLREQMIAKGWSRRYINERLPDVQVGRF